MAISPHALVGANVSWGEDLTVGHFSVLGSEIGGLGLDGSVRIGSGVRIGTHSIIYGDVEIGNRVSIDPFCRVGPYATVGDDCRLLYGARLHEEVSIGQRCIVSGNCPDRTKLGDEVVHLGRIAHGFHYPFEDDWDRPAEPGPTIGSRVVIGVDAIIIGSVEIGDNTFILPGEVVRESLPGNGMWRSGEWVAMPNWSSYLRLLRRFDGAVRRAPIARPMAGEER